MPLVSIIIPVHNAASFLEETLQSAVNQSWRNKEIILVDDGSTDESLSIARQYEGRGVKIICQENKGASAARNRGISVANGEWIQFLDADDFLREDKIERQLGTLKNKREIAVCKTTHFFTGDLQNAQPDDEHFYQAYLDDPLRFLVKLYGGFDYHSGMIQPNAFLTSREIIKEAGPWNEALSLDDDGEYFCRVLLNTERIVYDTEPMNFYRKHETANSLSGSKSERAFRSQFCSSLLKHKYLLEQTKDEDLVPYIHTATHKAMKSLLHEIYPHHKELYKEIVAFTKTLIKHHSRGNLTYGGSLANFIGNRISWKLLRRIQLFKAKQAL